MPRLAAAALLAIAPLAVHAQLAPRSASLDLGYTRDSAPALGASTPVGVGASWWIADDLDLTARLGLGFAPRTAGRAADARYEAGLGLRQALGTGRLRPYASIDAAFLLVSTGAIPTWEQGLRAGVEAGLEAFLVRDLSLACGGSAGAALLPSGAGAALGLVLRLTGYF